MILKLKSSEQIFIEIQSDGYIKIRQYNEFNPDSSVCLSLDQFQQAARWINKHETTIKTAWDCGVEDEQS